jgi:hypothetical protein
MSVLKETAVAKIKKVFEGKSEKVKHLRIVLAFGAEPSDK